MTHNLLDREITEAELNYVYFHLSHHIKTELSFNYIIGYHRKPQKNFNGIEIYKSDRPIDLLTKDTKTNIPLLFPGEDNDYLYSSEGSKFIVKHDIIKASFYLLSAYQEHKCDDLDTYGRYKWENSIQKRLNTPHIPLVNYYFEWLIDIIVLYCKANNLKYNRLNPLGKATLHLTHDIDLLRYNTFRKNAYRWAQILGIKECDTDKKRLTKQSINNLFKYLTFNKIDNPYWSFGKILNTEQYYGYKSSWFFLPKNNTLFDADYNIEDEDVVEIINKIYSLNNDIGLHISFNGNNPINISSELKRLKNTYSFIKNNTRAHFLKINIDSSFRDMYNASVETDCSFGFAKHEGYRNSYCFPFYPFDHEKQEIIPMLEIPLAIMDTTLLTHKKMSYEEIFDTLELYLEETRKFGGILSILWHNSTFDEVYNPGIVTFYEHLHKYFSQYSMQSFTTTDVTNKMNNSINSDIIE